MARLKYTFDPFELVGAQAPKNAGDREQALSDISDFILEEVLSKVGESRSPVTGRLFKNLSKEYRAKKVAAGRGGKPNLEFEGDMLEALKSRFNKAKSTVTLEITGHQGDKADGHHSGIKLPKRPFIPSSDEGQTFSPEIRKGIAAIIEAFEDGS